MLGKLRRVSLAQIGLMVTLLALGFAAPRLQLRQLYIAGTMLVGSASIVGMRPKE